MNKKEESKPIEPAKAIVRRSFSRIISETKIVGDKTITETKTEQWGDSPEADATVWKEMDECFEAMGKMLDKIGQQK